MQVRVDYIERLRLFNSTIEKVFINNKYKDLAKKLLAIAPDYFFVMPSSSTGKYHPEFENGKSGLIRHTQLLMNINREIYNTSYGYQIFKIKENSKEACDIFTLALMCHDFGKYYKPTSFIADKYPYSRAEHPMLFREIVAEALENNTVSLTEWEIKTIQIINRLIESHSGEWNSIPFSENSLPLPKTPGQCFVHLIDYSSAKIPRDETMDYRRKQLEIVKNLIQNKTFAYLFEYELDIFLEMCLYYAFILEVHKNISLSDKQSIDIKDFYNLISKNIENVNNMASYLYTSKITVLDTQLVKQIIQALNLLSSTALSYEKIIDTSLTEIDSGFIFDIEEIQYFLQNKDKATEKQIKFIKFLTSQKGYTKLIDYNNLTKMQASKLIDEIQKL